VTPSLYRPLSIGPLSLDGNLFLAPVAGWTERVFRSLCVEAGAALTFTELVSSEALVRGGAASFALLRRGRGETRLSFQLFGASPAVMAEAARRALAWKPDALDVNAGCPVPKVTKTGAGAALMRDAERLGAIVRAVVKAAREAAAEPAAAVPVTVKLRSGWDAASPSYEECALAAVEAGAALITLHPRSRSQGYEGTSDWEHIARLSALLPVPVAGSGDLFTPEAARAMLRQTGCAAVMFARGAQGNPFIFTQTRALLCEGGYTRVAAAEKIEIALRHLELLAADRGEERACREMRKVFCAYTRSAPGSAALRARLTGAQSIADYRAILNLTANGRE
jgi:nifR3 family TIM-barrel protein